MKTIKSKTRTSPAKDKAKAWLLERVQNQSIPMAQLISESGMTEMTLYRAADELFRAGQIAQIKIVPAREKAKTWLLENASNEIVTLAEFVRSSGMPERTLKRALDGLCSDQKFMQISNNPVAFRRYQ